MNKYTFITKETFNGVCAAYKDGMWGVIAWSDFDKEIIPAEFDREPIQFSKSDLILVSKNGKFGLYSTFGEEILPVIYDHLELVKKNRILAVRLDGRKGIFDEKGKEVIPFVYKALDYVSDKFIIAMKGNKFGAITIAQKEVIPFDYDEMEDIPELNLTITIKDGKYGLVDHVGVVLETTTWNNIKVSNTDGYIMRSGENNITVTQLYSDDANYCITRKDANYIKYLGENKFAIGVNCSFDGLRIMNDTGDIISSSSYDKIYDYRDGYAFAEHTRGIIILDAMGKEINTIDNSRAKLAIHNIGNGKFLVHDYKWKVIDIYGIPLAQDFNGTSLNFLDKGLLAVSIGRDEDERWGLIDLDGQTVLPTIYKTIKDINENGCATVVFVDPDTNEEYEGYVLINKQ